MKRLAVLAAILAIIAVQSAALADDFIDPAWYIGGDYDKIQVNAESYTTVRITKESDNTMVYVDQAHDVLDGATGFLLKQNPDIGKYNVYFGKQNGDHTQTYFYVGVDSNNSGDLYMKRLQNEEQNADKSGYNIGYYAEVAADYAETYKSLKVGYSGNSAYGGFKLDENWKDTNYTGEGRLKLIFQLNDVPEAWKDSITVFLSPDEVGNTPVKNNQQEGN